MWEGHKAAVNMLMLSRLHKNRLFSASNDQTVQVFDYLDSFNIWKVWDISVNGGESIQTLKNNAAAAVCMYNTPDRLYVGSSDKNIRVWKTHIDAMETLQGHTDKVTSFGILNDKLITSGLDSTINFWNVKVLWMRFSFWRLEWRIYQVVENRTSNSSHFSSGSRWIPVYSLHRFCNSKMESKTRKSDSYMERSYSGRQCSSIG